MLGGHGRASGRLTVKNNSEIILSNNDDIANMRTRASAGSDVIKCSIQTFAEDSLQRLLLLTFLRKTNSTCLVHEFEHDIQYEWST